MNAQSVTDVWDGFIQAGTAVLGEGDQTQVMGIFPLFDCSDGEGI